MDNAYVFAQFWISGIALVALYAFVFKQMLAEMCRTKIRAVRDDLFDYMWSNGLDMTDRSYRETRQMLNGLLRMTCEIGPLAFIMLMIRCSSSPKKVSARILPDSPLNGKLRKSKDEAIDHFLTFLYFQGVVGFLVRGIWYGLTAIRALKKSKDWVQREAVLLTEMGMEFGAKEMTGRQHGLVGSW